MELGPVQEWEDTELEDTERDRTHQLWPARTPERPRPTPPLTEATTPPVPLRPLPNNCTPARAKVTRPR